METKEKKLNNLNKNIAMTMAVRLSSTDKKIFQALLKATQQEPNLDLEHQTVDSLKDILKEFIANDYLITEQRIINFCQLFHLLLTLSQDGGFNITEILKEFIEACNTIREINESCTLDTNLTYRISRKLN